MDVVDPGCGGLAVHPARLTAGLRRVPEDGQMPKDVPACATPSPALLVVLDGRIAPHGPVVALERPGVEGPPVSHGLAGTIAGHMRQDKPEFPLITYRYAALGMPSCWLALQQ
jgi:hypothetical protein